ncbi:DUF3240 domain-containing protein [Shewanella sp. Choline-02u-19]|uniref:DUF3240 family protein n=1 Tax=unclassified Shewanella TaxID=196818 RepID=UPI000C3382AF|nr:MULTISPECIES: DUF3240 family protein [unclassified Shewanella]PKH56050.1 DUF3240 domain-containing protein [Shewanella sp. Bg11-22]PKI30639.1 DUF3240 domain-containing protein [Shewanella sp. Choline-02u-19]
MNTEQLLVLIAQNDIKDDIVDTLIDLDFLSGFSLGNICGFSREHSHFNIKEQVGGYREFCKFEIMHPTAQQDALLQALAVVCKHNPCRYWIMPIQLSGTLC